MCSQFNLYCEIEGECVFINYVQNLQIVFYKLTIKHQNRVIDMLFKLWNTTLLFTKRIHLNSQNIYHEDIVVIIFVMKLPRYE